jgi:hypothetical protein
MPDGIIDGCWNPASAKNDLAIHVDGSRLDFLWRRGLAAFEDVQEIPTTLKDPDSVFETVDGDWLYFRQPSRQNRPDQVFFVRVRPTGSRAFVWDFEPADPKDNRLPMNRGADRISRRLR